MRTLRIVVGACLALVSAGCDVRNLWREDADRINEAIPPSDAVSKVKYTVDKMLADDPDSKARLQREYTSRLAVRATQCAKQGLSVWDSTDDIRAKLGEACFEAADEQLLEWIQSARLRILLEMPPLRTVPASPPALIATANAPSVVGVALDAPVMAAVSRRRLEILDAGTGKTIYLERELPAAPSFVAPSPNGRVVAMDEQGSVVLRDSSNGEVLIRYEGHRSLAWLDASAALILNQDTNTRSLLDLAAGTITPAKGISNFWGKAERVSRKPLQFVIADLHRIIKFELRSDESGHEIVILDQRDAPSSGGSNGSLTATSDGKFVARPGGSKFLISDTERLDTKVVDTDPFDVLQICPLEDPNELLMKGAAGDVRAGVSYYIYSVDDGALSPVEDERLVAPGGYTNSCSIVIPVFDAVYVQSAGVFKRFNEVRRGLKYHAAAWPAYFEELREAQRIKLEVGYARGMQGANNYAMRPPTKAVLGDIAKDSSVLAVGVYEPANSSRGAGSPHVPGPVTVIVRPSDKPIVLVLSSYEIVNWRLTVMPGARLKAVLLGGYKESTVVGAGDVRVVTIKGYAYEHGSSGYGTLNQEVMRWTGKPIDSLQGRYSGSTFLVGGY